MVLIGDSEFISGYVDWPQETLWARLWYRSGLQVFPAGLTGATPLDMLLVARRVAALCPRGTIAFVGIIPTRIFLPQAASVPNLPGASHYSAQFKLLFGHHYDDEAWLQRIEGDLVFEAARKSFLIRNQEFVLRYLERRLSRQPRPFHDAVYRNRTWSIDGDSALNAFRRLEVAVAAGGGGRVVPFSWIRSLQRALTERGIRPVFVLTPLNTALIHRYSNANVPTERVLTDSHEYLVRALLASGYSYIDLFSAAESSAFADVLHTNSGGDDAIARALSDWLRGQNLAPKPGRPGIGLPTPLRQN